MSPFVFTRVALYTIVFHWSPFNMFPFVFTRVAAPRRRPKLLTRLREIWKPSPGQTHSESLSFSYREWKQLLGFSKLRKSSKVLNTCSSPPVTHHPPRHEAIPAPAPTPKAVTSETLMLIVIASLQKTGKHGEYQRLQTRRQRQRHRQHSNIKWNFSSPTTTVDFLKQKLRSIRRQKIMTPDQPRNSSVILGSGHQNCILIVSICSNENYDIV